MIPNLTNWWVLSTNRQANRSHNRSWGVGVIYSILIRMRVSKTILFLVSGAFCVFGLMACKASDQPPQDQPAAMQPARDAAAPSQDLQRDLQDEKGRAEQAEQQVRQMQAELRALQDDNAKLTQQLQPGESATLDLAACRQELSDMQNRLAQEHDLAVNLRTEQTKLIEEHADLRGKSKALGDLKGEMTDAEQRLAAAHDELAQANEQVEILQTELQTLQQDYSALQETAARVSQLEESLSVLQAEQAIFEQGAQEEAQLQQQLLDTRKELAEANLKLEQLEALQQSELPMQ